MPGSKYVRAIGVHLYEKQTPGRSKLGVRGSIPVAERPLYVR